MSQFAPPTNNMFSQTSGYHEISCRTYGAKNFSKERYNNYFLYCKNAAKQPTPMLRGCFAGRNLPARFARATAGRARLAKRARQVYFPMSSSHYAQKFWVNPRKDSVLDSCIISRPKPLKK